LSGVRDVVTTANGAVCVNDPGHLAPRSGVGAAELDGIETTPHSMGSWNPYDPEVRRVRRLRRMKRAIGAAGDVIQLRSAPNGHRIVPLMLTLTYAQGWLWQPNQVSRLIDDVRRYCRRRGHDPAHVWVMELQKRGVPHYHVVVWVRADIRLPNPAAAGWWPWGFTHVLRATRPVGYLLKYASKLESKRKFPFGARIFGRGGLDQGERRFVAWWVLPRYQRDRCQPEDRSVRRRGGGWVSMSSGEIWPAWEPAVLSSA
jgi:hypothetical protein